MTPPRTLATLRLLMSSSKAHGSFTLIPLLPLVPSLSFSTQLRTLNQAPAAHWQALGSPKHCRPTPLVCTTSKSWLTDVTLLTCSCMSPPSLTLCFLSCFPLSLFTSIIVYLCLLPLASVHINRPLPFEGRQFVPPIPGSLAHLCISLGHVAWCRCLWRCACLSVAGYH